MRKISSLLILFTPFWLFSYPMMQKLDPKDPVFLQQQESVKHFFQAFHQKEEFLPLEIFEYVARRADSLFSISARLMLPYSTVATMNQLSHADLPLEGTTLYIPNTQGLFLPLKASTELTSTIAKRVNAKLSSSQIITINEQSGYFLVGEDFTPYERKLFLQPAFSFPLQISRITSFYGNRIHPVYGYTHFHNGIDFGTALNTPVYATRKGIVRETGASAVMGNYVLIDHDFAFSSFYGHLKKILVTLNTEVTITTEIGKAGSTGVSTGAHLHFEILHNNENKNPLSYLPKYYLKN